MKKLKERDSEKTSNNKSIRKVLSYYLDNALAKSSNFVIYIILISFILGIFMTFLKDFLSLNEEDGFFDNWWVNVSEILELGQGDNWADRLVEFIFWMIGIAITGTVIAFLSTKINSFFKKMSRGRSFIIDSGHILIIGWSNNLFAILKELNSANESNPNQKIIIFSNRDNTTMQDDLSLISPQLKYLNVITRSGDPTNPSEIRIPNPNQAKCILILNNENKGDPYVVTSTLSVCSVLTEKDIPIISSVREKYYYESLKNIIEYNIIPVMPENVISNVSAQSLRQRGLGLVVLDFLDFDGDEIYFKHIPELVGSTFLEAVMSFENSSVIGIHSGASNVKLAVQNDHVISKNDQLIFVAQDDSKIHLTKNTRSLTEVNLEQNQLKVLNKKKILFLGWSSVGNKILDAISGFLDKKTVIDVIYIDKYVSPLSIKKDYPFAINFISISTVHFDLNNKLVSENYDDVMILGYSDKLPIDEADTFTLLKSLELDSLSRKEKFNFRILTHLLNSSKSKLSEITHSKEIIISDNLAALLMAQLSENPSLYAVFEQLFSSDYSSINIFPIDYYVGINKDIPYADIVLAAAHKNHYAIGILYGDDSLNTEERLNMNPLKSKIIKPALGDSLIVIS